MTYDPRDPIGSMAEYEHDKRRRAAHTVVRHCGAGPDGAMVLDMLGLFDRSLLSTEPPRGLRRELSEVPPPFVP